MTQLRSIFLGSLLAILAGCGSGSAIDPKTAPVTGPHGGVAYVLPDDAGYAEVFLERGKATSRVAGKITLSVYFLNKDLKAAIDPPPSDVSASIITPEKTEPITLELKRMPLAKEPLSAARFASEPGPYDFDEIHGEIKATVGGKPFQKEFAVR